MQENDDIQIVQSEQVSTEVLTLLTKAEIDAQVATARAFPRSIKAFMEKVRSIATISESVAESCQYALKRQGKEIIGPSVRFAEIVVNSYGNIRAAARVVANDGKTITAQGICHDLETNTATTIEVKRRITDKNGRTFSEDMQVVTGNAACAIAYRNAVFKVVPTALTEDIFEEVQKVAKGTAVTLSNRRMKAVEWFFEKHGIKSDVLFKKLGVKGLEDIDLDKLQILNGFKSALKNGEETPVTLFAEDEDEKAPVKKEEQRIESLVAGKSYDEVLKIGETIPEQFKPFFNDLVERMFPNAQQEQPVVVKEEKPKPEPEQAKAKKEPKTEPFEVFKKIVDDANEATMGDCYYLEELKKHPKCDTPEKAAYIDQVIADLMASR